MAHGLHPLCGDVAKILIQSTICQVYVEHGQLNIDEEVAIAVGKLLLHPEVLGSEANDGELLVGNNKVTNLMGDMDSTNTLSHGRKTNDKGKEKATKACQQWKSFRLVDNSDIEYSDIKYGSNNTYIDNDNVGSYYSDSSIEYLNVKDNALRRTIVTNSPEISSRQLVDHVKVELNVDVSEYKCQRVKRIIKNELEGTYIMQYKYLRGYGEHMLATNVGSSCIIGIEDSTAATPYQFKMMYFCFDGCKKGWKVGSGCISGLDGNILKGVCQDILLLAIGRDGNNQMFLVARAIVDTEDKDNWKWFMELLNIDLECGDGTEMTFIRHLSIRDEVFSRAKHRAFFTEDANYDVIDNNMCESFNFSIMDARYKAIINLADTLKGQAMERITNKKELMKGWNGDIALRAKDKLEENKNEPSQCKLL
ncbi:hypothetical protein SLEP1_g12413 [Rubroshorea leprosula]|uniref:MULE transposase domain-containing protein n=1 Tax=Rubroshorea leprosula TaxID=152421 RepID=A0AAV5INV4_9ROSI|nr:hypothetical protein SLEP1_g12413 [Rubroshorea leprosula]